MDSPAIDAHHLTKKYGSARGITDVTLQVQRGERFGFLGPNGAGKTTFIRVALGMLRPQAGDVSLMGFSVSQQRMEALAQVGYLPGELSLYGALSGHRTLDALGRLHPRPPELRAELCDVLGLGDRDLARPTRHYSRGMKQKIGLISALQHDPPLAILDEPTGGLDPVVQLQLMDWLAHRASKGMTVFFSSHILAEVEALCDRVAMVRDGQLVLMRDVHSADDATSVNVTVRFGEPVRECIRGAAGICDLQVQEGGLQHRFRFEGDHDALVRALTEHHVEKLTMAPESLEQQVRQLYSPGATQ